MGWRPNYMVFKIIKIILLYIEEWVKTIKVIFYKIIGYNVLVDRHPTFQYFAQKGVAYYVNKLMYDFLFFTPKRVIVLYEASDIIAKRKEELTENEITEYYDLLRRELKTSEALWVKNGNINETISTIMDKYFHA